MSKLVYCALVVGFCLISVVSSVDAASIAKSSGWSEGNVANILADGGDGTGPTQEEIKEKKAAFDESLRRFETTAATLRLLIATKKARIAVLEDMESMADLYDGGFPNPSDYNTSLDWFLAVSNWLADMTPQERLDWLLRWENAEARDLELADLRVRLAANESTLTDMEDLIEFTLMLKERYCIDHPLDD